MHPFIKLHKLAMPFGLLGLTFISIGLLLGDSVHLNFGLVWMAIARVVIIFRIIVLNTK
jgi:hypothetical protein